MIQGKVYSVSTAKAGGTLLDAVAAGITVLPLEDASDFDEFGGQVSIDGVVYDYTEADMDEDTLVLATPLVAAVEDGEMAFLHPVAEQTTALVVLDDGSEIEARVSKGVAVTLNEGERVDEDAETVALVLDGGTYVVTDVIGRPTVFDAENTWLVNVEAALLADQSTLGQALEDNEAALEAARGRLTTAEAELLAAKDRLTSAEAHLSTLDTDLGTNTQALADAQAELDQAKLDIVAAKQEAIDAAAANTDTVTAAAKAQAIYEAGLTAQQKADQAEADAIAAAAGDATTKSNAAKDAAIAAAASDATTKDNALKTAVIADAQTKANAARDAAIAAAAGDATAKTDALRSVVNTKNTTYETTTSVTGPTAPSGGFVVGDLWIDKYRDSEIKRWSGSAWTVLDVQTLADVTAAKNAAVSTAATDATAKADAARAAAVTTAQGLATTAKNEAISAAATDATNKADAVKAIANTKASTYYTTTNVTAPPTPAGGFVAGDLWIDKYKDSEVKRWSGSAWVVVDIATATDVSGASTTAKNEAIAAAAIDAQTRANAARDAAIADAQTKANAARDAAITAAATDATNKDNALKTAVIADAQTKATTAKNEAIAAASTDATNKATTAKTDAIAAAALKADELDDLLEARTLSRGTDLVTNGTGSMGNNTNFSQFTLDKTDAPIGAAGSFDSAAPGVSATRVIDEFLPVDTNKRFMFSFQAKQKGTTTGGYMYSGVIPYDAYKLQISPYHTMFTPGTLTALALPVNPGDTTITIVTPSTPWYGSAGKNAGASTHLRSIIWWDYTDPGGKTWPEETYSRYWSGANYWADGAISGNVITLNAPYSGPVRPAGTKLSNGSSGGTSMYGGTGNTIIPKEWTRYSATITGVITGGAGPSFANGWPVGTAYAKIVWLTDRTVNGSSDGQSRHSVAAVSFSDASAANYAAHNITETQITDGAISTPKIQAGAVVAGKLAANSVLASNIKANEINATHLAIGDMSNMATINESVPGQAAYSNWTHTIVNGWSTRSVNTDTYFMFRQQTGPLPFKTGDRIRLSFEAYADAAVTCYADTWLYGNATVSQRLGTVNIKTTVESFDFEMTVTADTNLKTSFLIGLVGVGGRAVFVRNVRAYRMNAGELIVDGTITGNKIKTDAIDARTIKADSVGAVAIAAGAVEADKIKAGAIGAVAISAGAIETDKLAANAVTTVKIATDAVDARTVKAQAIGTVALAADAVTADKIAANAITATKISAGAVNTIALDADAVTAAKIATDAVEAKQIKAGAVGAIAIAANAVEADKIKADAVVAGKIAANAITSREIQAGTITAGSAIIADGAITNAKIQTLDVSKLRATSAAMDTAVINKVAADIANIVKANIGNLTVTGDTHLSTVVAQRIGADTAAFINLKVEQLVATGTSTLNTVVAQTIASGIADIVQANIGNLTVTGDTHLNTVTAQRIGADVGSYVQLTVDQLLAGNLDVMMNVTTGGKIVAGDPAGRAAEMEADGFYAYDINPDGERYRSTMLGGPGADQLSLLDANGEIISGMASDGTISGTALDITGDAHVAGKSLVGAHEDSTQEEGWLDELARGVVARQYFQTNSPSRPAGEEWGYGIINFTAEPKRLYRIGVNGDATIGVVGGLLRTRFRVATGGASATVTSPQDGIWTSGASGSSSVAVGFTMDTFVGYSEKTEVEALLTYSGHVNATPSINWAEMWVEDVGQSKGYGAGEYATGREATPPPAKKTYTSWWYANGSASYKESGSKRTDASDMVQGYTSYATINGHNQAAAIFTGTAASGETSKTISQALSGATLTKAEVYLYFTHWYYGAGGTARIGKLGASSIPTTLSATASKASSKWPRGAGRWVEVPTSWFSDSNRGITIGGGSSTSAEYYGRAVGHTGSTSQRPKVRLTYTR